MGGPDRARLARTLFVLSLLGGAVVLFLPGPGGVEHFRYEDKVIHAIVFGVPTVLGLLGRLRRAPLVAALVAYAAVSEVIQGAFLATRAGSARDWLADVAGVALGLALVALVRARRHTRE